MATFLSDDGVMTRYSRPRAALATTTLSLLTIMTASCGGGQANIAATGSSTGGSAGATSAASGTNGTSSETGGTTSASTQSPSTTGPGSMATPAGLPTVPYTYGDLLLKAWATGDRKAAARYATPAAVLALFNHKPIAKLVNFECGEGENPILCGWTGAGDAQVILGIDKDRLAKGALQAVVAAQVTTG